MNKELNIPRVWREYAKFATVAIGSALACAVVIFATLFVDHRYGVKFTNNKSIKATGTYTIGDGSFTDTGLLVTSSVPLDMGTHLINNVVDPVSAQDAVTLNYFNNHGAAPNVQSEWFGDGADGVQHFDGVSAVLGFSPITLDGITQLYRITRDVDLATGSVIDAGVTVYMEDARLDCNGTLTNNGHISMDGRPAVTLNGGNVLQSHVLAVSNQGGGQGTNGPGPGSQGGNGGSAPNSWPNVGVTAAGANGGGTGQGGGGGSAGGQVGGGGGSVTNVGTENIGRLDIIARFTGRQGGTGLYNASYSTGSGGGGGACVGGSTGAGGGGGASGGWLFVGIQHIAGTGTISAKGGAGAAGTLGNSTGCGGGGGGGGGVLTVIYSTNGGNTLSVAGGAGGAGVGTGANGGTGSQGLLQADNLSGDGT